MIRFQPHGGAQIRESERESELETKSVREKERETLKERGRTKIKV